MLTILKGDIQSIMKQLDEGLDDTIETNYYDDNVAKEVLYINKQKLINELSKYIFDVQPNETVEVELVVDGTHSITIETEEELSIGSFYDGVYTDYITFDKDAQVYYTFYIEGTEDGWLVDVIEFDYEQI